MTLQPEGSPRVGTATNQPALSRTPRHPRAALLTLTCAICLVVCQATTLNVALPTITAGMSLSFTTTQWLGSLYALVLASLLVAATQLSDRLGRMPVLLMGVAAFVAASILAGASTSATTLLLARAAQGAGAALVLPSALALVSATCADKPRTVAFAIVGWGTSAAAALGSVIGGALTTYVDSRWIFWINVPIGAVIVLAAVAFVPGTSRVPDTGFDALGAATSLIGLGGLGFGIVAGLTSGWLRPTQDLSLGPLRWGSTWPVAAAPVLLVAGVAGLAGFVIVERRRAAAGRSVVLDPALFQRDAYRRGSASALLIAVAEFGSLFVLALYLQNGAGMSPLIAGAVTATVAIGTLLSGAATSALARRWNPVPTARLGVALAAAGVAAVGLSARPQAATWVIVAGLACYGLGLGLCSAPPARMICRDDARPPARPGGSVTTWLARQAGAALGVAIMSTVFGRQFDGHMTGSLTTALPPTDAGRMQRLIVDSAGSALVAIHENRSELPTGTARAITATATRALSDATAVTLLVCAAILALAFVATWSYAHRSRTRGAAASPGSGVPSARSRSDADAEPTSRRTP